ncbi:MAG: glycosyltransferase family 2 protein [Spirochaetes bacterium]|jgi:glycosyltransferase involved in cell wall biosynthesis|nr:glycosyltransferase family 2 protein [Spirochaetota bacterium]
MPFFSVIIPAYNRRSMLTRAVESVLSQTFTDYELIVVDDGSTDGTGEEMEKYGGRVRYIRQDNRGVSAARNAGIAASVSPYLAFLDSDDEWFPGKLAAHGEFIASHPGIRIHQAEEAWIRNGRRVNPGLRHVKRDGDIFIDSLELCLISPSAVVMNRELFDEYGTFDENMPACEDYDLWLRITPRESVGIIRRHLLSRHAGHSGQLSSAFWGMDRFRLYSIIKLLKEKPGSLTGEYRAAAAATAMKKARILLAGAEKRGRLEFSGYMSDVIGKLADGSCSSIDCRSLLEKQDRP